MRTFDSAQTYTFMWCLRGIQRALIDGGAHASNDKPRRSGVCIGAKAVTAYGARSQDRQGRGREARTWLVQEFRLKVLRSRGR